MNRTAGIIFVIVILIALGIKFLVPSPTLNDSNLTINGAKTSNEPCLITVNGNRYDVSSLRKIHEGGDIFICGSDMTDDFMSEHGDDFQRLEEYKVD